MATSPTIGCCPQTLQWSRTATSGVSTVAVSQRASPLSNIAITQRFITSHWVRNFTTWAPIMDARTDFYTQGWAMAKLRALWHMFSRIIAAAAALSRDREGHFSEPNQRANRTLEAFVFFASSSLFFFICVFLRNDKKGDQNAKDEGSAIYPYQDGGARWCRSRDTPLRKLPFFSPACTNIFSPQLT